MLSPTLDFGKTVSHFLPGLVLCGSIFMIAEVLSEIDLTTKITSSANYFFGAAAIAVIAGFVSGLFIDLFFHHRVLEQEIYCTQRFFKLLNWFYKEDYAQRYEALRSEEKDLYRDKQGKPVTDYYFLTLVGVDAREHLLTSGTYYCEFFSNISFSLMVFGTAVGLLLLKYPTALGELWPYSIFLSLVATTSLELLAFFCIIVGGAINIQYRERKVDMIKGALRFCVS